MLDILNQSLSLILSNPLGRIIYAIVTGLILALSLAGYGWGFLAWFSLIPLILLIKSSDTIKGSLLDSFIFLFVYNLASFVWLLALHPLTWQGLTNTESIVVTLLAWITPSISHSLILIPFIVICKLFFIYRADERSYELKILDILFLTFLWTTIEFKLVLGLGDNLRSFFVPINFLAYSQYKNLHFIQIANLFGSIGIEYFIVFTNLILSNLFNVHKIHTNRRIIRSNLNVKKQFFGIERSRDYVEIGVLVSVLVIASYAYGFYNIDQYKKAYRVGKHQKIAILQADYSAQFTRSTQGFQKLTQMQTNLSKSLSTQVDFLFWTEGAIPRSNYDSSALVSELKSKARSFNYGTFITEGNNTYNGLRSFSHSEEVIVNNLGVNGTTTTIYNDFPEDHYKKKVLVPYGEYTPFYKQLPGNLQSLANHSIGSGFTASKEIKNIKTAAGNYAPSICFEILFPEHIRKFVNEDTNFLVNLNDLSWFKNTVSIFGIELNFLKGFVHRMMLAAATFRAIENNRDLVLASNSGISCIIKATGSRERQTKINNIEMLEDRVLVINSPSIYTRFGW